MMTRHKVNDCVWSTIGWSSNCMACFNRNGRNKIVRAGIVVGGGGR